MQRLDEVYADLVVRSDSEKAAHAQRFFKTGPGEYGEGDRFRGIRVPVLRDLTRKYWKLPLESLDSLLTSPHHEDRLLALLCMVRRFQKGTENERELLYDMYLRRTDFVNNWDLVDSSAEYLVGAYLWNRDRSKIYELARSPSLWERRIAMLATFHYIKKNEFQDALAVAEVLSSDSQDLIHKAVGWMLREIAQRDMNAAQAFLRRHYRQLPRTMLRYAIEKFPEDLRQDYLHGRA